MNRTNNSMHIQDRTAINAMTAEWIAKNGEPRRFERGFSGEWFNLKSIMAGLGYEIAMKSSGYTVKKIGEPGKPLRLSREKALRRIDEILIENGKQPFLRRS